MDPRLDKGEVVITTKKIGDSPIPQATVRAVVDAPPEKVWPLVENCDKYKETMVRVKDARVISRQGSTVICETTIDMPFPLADLTSRTTAIHTVKPGQLWQRKWTLLKGDYHVNDGSWTVKPWKDGKSLVEYRIHAVPKIPVPGFLQEAAQSSSLPKLIQNLRAKVAAL